MRSLKTKPEAKSDATAVPKNAQKKRQKNIKSYNHKNDKQSKGGKKKQVEPDEDETKQAEDTASDEAPQTKGKNKGKQQGTPTTGNMGNKGNGSNKKTKTQVEQPKKGGEDPTISKDEETKFRAVSQPPPRRPDLLMPVNAQVLQVEHSVESADDPRPNAFYDSEHGIMRVYHGGAYGNPYGALYPKRWAQNIPLGVPHPSQNPWLYGLAPSHAPVPPPQGYVPPIAQGPGPGNPWFQGHFTTQVPGPVTPKPKDNRGVYNESPSLRAAAKRDSNNNNNNNVGPFAPRDSQVGTTKPRSNADNNGGWGVQGAHNSIGAANNGWSPQDSQKLQESLQKLGSRNGSNAGSKKNDDGWGANDGWGNMGNIDNNNTGVDSGGDNIGQANNNTWSGGDNNQMNGNTWGDGVNNTNSQGNDAGGADA